MFKKQTSTKFKIKEPEICECPCHTHPYSFMHFMPCCWYCTTCGQNISTDYAVKEHEENCKSKSDVNEPK